MLHNPKSLEKDKLGVLPVHISYGVLSTNFDGTLFNVKAAVSRAQPQNDNGRSDWLIIDRTMSNRVRLRRSDTLFSKVFQAA